MGQPSSNADKQRRRTRPENPVELVEAVSGLSREELARSKSGNAIELLRLA